MTRAGAATRRGLFATMVAVVAACGGPDEPAIVVEVERRPSVVDVARLSVTVSNEGASQTTDFSVEGRDFPLTFSITAAGRVGPIEIAIAAFGEDASEVARGAAVADAAAESAAVMLDPADFVVNTEFAGAQFLNQDAETNGFQLAAGGGVVTFGWRDDCPVTACNQFGRRYGLDARPLPTELGAGTNQFRWNEFDGQGVAHVGMATQSDGTTLAMWDTPSGVSCRAIPPGGMGASFEQTVAGDLNVDVVSVVALADGYFAATWTASDAGQRVIRVAVLEPDCGVRVLPYTAAGPIVFAHRPTIAATPRATLLAWIDSGEARYRIGTSAGVFSAGAGNVGDPLITVPTPDTVDFVRVVGVDDGFVVLYRRALGPDDAIALHRVDEAGTARGTDTILATMPPDYGAPALVVRPEDGALAAAWQQCDDTDGSSCGVIARLVRQSGVPVGDAFVVNTTTRGDQTDPSIVAIDGGFVVAWSDTSAQPPDVDDSAVRGRYIYPAFATARGVLGATCATSAECGAAQVCAPDARGDKVCHAACAPGGPPPLCPGGGSCTTVASESYCVLGGS